ncbi:MAG: hypothetical protein KDJ15_00765 [Alphaproteobacteria bacterium]|nr:hypothetical protein [Alphaproteobacteria bacterium]
MTLDGFNTITAKQLYTYRRNPLHAASFLLLKQNETTGAYVPVGDYTVLDKNEDPALSEKKIMNIVSILNGRTDQLVPVGEKAPGRLFYHPTPRTSPEERTKVVFYSWEGKGVSKENGLLTIEEDFDRDH